MRIHLDLNAFNLADPNLLRGIWFISEDASGLGESGRLQPLREPKRHHSPLRKDKIFVLTCLDYNYRVKDT